MGRYPGIQWEMEANASALPLRRIKQFNAPAVVFQNFGNDGQAKACAFRPRRHIGFKQPLPVVRRKTLSVINDINAGDIIHHAERDTNARRRFFRPVIGCLLYTSRCV